MIVSLVILGLAALMGGFLMGFLHYYIRRSWGLELRPPWTYVVGVLFGIFAPFAAWCGFHWLLVGPIMPALLPIGAFALCAAVPGLVVVQCYQADKRDEERQKAQQNAEFLAVYEEGAKAERLTDVVD